MRTPALPSVTILLLLSIGSGVYLLREPKDVKGPATKVRAPVAVEEPPASIPAELPVPRVEAAPRPPGAPRYGLPGPRTSCSGRESPRCRKAPTFPPCRRRQVRSVAPTIAGAPGAVDAATSRAATRFFADHFERIGIKTDSYTVLCTPEMCRARLSLSEIEAAKLAEVPQKEGLDMRYDAAPSGDGGTTVAISGPNSAICSRVSTQNKRRCPQNDF